LCEAQTESLLFPGRVIILLQTNGHVQRDLRLLALAAPKFNQWRPLG
jgi:hypothetical protein